MDNDILSPHSPSILQRQGSIVQRDPLSSQSDQTEVSGQSIFWALVPLALNIMVQPTGQTLGFPKRYALMLRSSPIACAVDGAVALGALIHYIRQGSSLTTAVHRLMESRFQGSTGPTVQDNSLSALFQNNWLRLFLFEFLAFIGKRNQNQASPQNGTLTRSTRHDMMSMVARMFGYLTITMQIGLWFTLSFMIFLGMDYRFRAEVFKLSEADVFCCFCLCFCLMLQLLLIVLFLDPDSSGFLSITTSLWNILFGANWTLTMFFTFYLVIHSSSPVHSLHVTTIQPIYMVYAWAAFPFILFLVGSCLRLGRYRVGKPLIRHWLAWHFLIFNAVFAYCYYILAWDPHGTVAPGWTTYLG